MSTTAFLYGADGGGSSATLGTKSITANGTYAASSDNLDGYSEVTVTVPPTLFRQLVDRSIITVTADDLAGVTVIGSLAFRRCSNLTSISFPDTLTDISDYGVGDCSNLTQIIFSTAGRLSTIGEGGLRGNKVQKLDLPEGLTAIGTDAIGSCSLLKEVTYPTTINTIAFWGIRDCPQLKKIVFTKNTPPILYGGSSAFTGLNSSVIFYFPLASMSNYINATNWVDVWTRLPYAPLVTSVADLQNIDTSTYTKACVRTNGVNTYYEYLNNQWEIEQW